MVPGFVSQGIVPEEMRCLGRTKASNFYKRCNQQTLFLFCWQHAWQLLLVVVAAAVAVTILLLAISGFSGYSLRDLLSKQSVYAEPNITCALVFPTETEDHNPEVVFRNDGPVKAISIYWDVKVYRYDSVIDDITAYAILGSESRDHPFFHKKINPSEEFRHSTIGLSGDNLLAIYLISGFYYVEPNTQPFNLENYYFVENNRINDSIQFKKDSRYNDLMQKIEAFDISQASASPDIDVHNAKATPNGPTVALVPESPVKVVHGGESPESPIVQPLSIQASYVYRAGGTGPLLPITRGGELNSGDHYKIYFKANQDCYVYVYQTDATGQIFRLFPLKQFDGVMLNHNNPVKAEADVVLPSKDRFFYLDDIIGKEKILFVASVQRNIELEVLDNTLKKSVRSKNKTQISRAKKNMADYLTTRVNSGIIKTLTSPVAWQANDATSPVLGYLIKSMEKDSFHEVEFFHR